MAQIAPAKITRRWTFTYTRPPRMGWTNLSWTDAWRPDRPLTIGPLEVQIVLHQPHGGAPAVQYVKARGRWANPGTGTPGRVRRLDTSWIGLRIPGGYTEADCRMDAPDWVLELAADAVRRAWAEAGLAEEGH